MVTCKLLCRQPQLRSQKPGSAVPSSVRAGFPCLRTGPVTAEHARKAGRGRRAFRQHAGRDPRAETLSLGGVDAITQEVNRLKQENERLLAEQSASDQRDGAGGAETGAAPQAWRAEPGQAAPSSVANGASTSGGSASSAHLAQPAAGAPPPRQAAGGRRQAGVEQAETPLDIVFVSAEVAPWSKTGGLGDVVGSLPIALAARGHRVMVVAPRYLNGGPNDMLYEDAVDTGVRVVLALGNCGVQTAGFFHLHRDLVDWVFVDNPVFHRPGNPYGDEHGVFGDNQFRYALLSLAACEAPLQLQIGGYRHGDPPGFAYGERCVFVSNDWHAALMPSYLAAKYRRNGIYKEARCIFTIHNLSHQGVEPAATFANLGLPDDWYQHLQWEYPSWASINGPAVNLLKGAILCSDRVVTVSKGYAWEICTSEGGWGLHQVLQGRQHVLNGITNGIDMDEWDPSADSHTPAAFSAEDTSGKAACKAALQAKLGFDVDARIPLIGWIGRLDHQKGPDVALDAVPGIAQRGCQMVMLGSGSAKYEAAMRAAEAVHRPSFRGWVGFSVPVAHRIVAGCDVLLMPSRFEPCGLNQLFAMRYGTVPIAHATGGLRDTIRSYDPHAADGDVGTGWTFSPPDAPAMLVVLDRALEVRWHQPDVWAAIMRAGMTADLSWNRAAAEYEQVFAWALMDEPARAF